MASESKTAQINFIKRIKDVIPPNHSLVDELADVLAISTDSAYRRIRGETSLTIDEVSKLCSHYKISFDVFGGNLAGSVTFNYHLLGNETLNFVNYLQNIRDDLKKIKQASDKKEIIFAAEDLPIFHHFRYPALSAFKLFYWKKSILNSPELDNQRFSPDVVSDEVLAVVTDIYRLYLDVPSIEIWTDDTLNSTLKQVQYYWESGLFTDADAARAVLNDIRMMINSIQKQAETSCKFDGEHVPPGREQNYQLYNSDLMVANNSILVTIGSHKAVYISHNTMNSMVTINSSFCEETERWLRNLIRKSILISGVGEKQRFQFFRRMNEKIKQVEDSLN